MTMQGLAVANEVTGGSAQLNPGLITLFGQMNLHQSKSFVLNADGSERTVYNDNFIDNLQQYSMFNFL